MTLRCFLAISQWDQYLMIYRKLYYKWLKHHNKWYNAKVLGIIIRYCMKYNFIKDSEELPAVAFAMNMDLPTGNPKTVLREGGNLGEGFNMEGLAAITKTLSSESAFTVKCLV